MPPSEGLGAVAQQPGDLHRLETVGHGDGVCEAEEIVSTILNKNQVEGQNEHQAQDNVKAQDQVPDPVKQHQQLQDAKTQVESETQHENTTQDGMEILSESSPAANPENGADDSQLRQDDVQHQPDMMQVANSDVEVEVGVANDVEIQALAYSNTENKSTLQISVNKSDGDLPENAITKPINEENSTEAASSNKPLGTSGDNVEELSAQLQEVNKQNEQKTVDAESTAVESAEHQDELGITSNSSTDELITIKGTSGEEQQVRDSDEPRQLNMSASTGEEHNLNESQLSQHSSSGEEDGSESLQSDEVYAVPLPLDESIDDAAIAMLLAQDEQDSSSTSASREESMKRRHRADMQDEAELVLLRALLAAEQAKDVNQINLSQGKILTTEMDGYEDDAENFSVPSDPEDDFWRRSGLLDVEEDEVDNTDNSVEYQYTKSSTFVAVPKSTDQANESPSTFTSQQVSETQQQSVSQQTEASDAASSGWSFSRGIARARALASGSARATPRDKADEQGFTEEEMLTILGTEVEEDYIARFKVMLEQKLGADFFFEHDDLASNLDFWARACLRARRFRVARAVELMRRYAECKVEIETQIDSDKMRVRELLTSGVLCFLGGARCREGRGILVLRMGLHDPRKFQATDLLAAAHETIIHAIEKYPRLQAVGFTIINDMTGATSRNFDSKVPKLLSRTIESRLPLRYGRVIVVNPPSFFSAVFRVVSFFLSAKMRKRMIRVNYKPSESEEGDVQTIESQNGEGGPTDVAAEVHDTVLENYILKEHLPTFLGGNRVVDYAGFAMQLVPDMFNYAYSNDEEATLAPFSPSSLSMNSDADYGASTEGADSANSSPASKGKRSPREYESLDESQFVHSAFV
mmetsp:Transcript_498/g.1223  ORF Transcript_498/g.1223 Transcript_498/m.1223 type:complete len:870 (+) Transcript_498:214-2823(+)